MICWNCGKEVSEGHRFCANCGADLSQVQQPQPEQTVWQEQPQPEQTAWQTQTAQDTGNTYQRDTSKDGNVPMPFKIFAIAGAAFYGIRALAFLFTVIRDLFQFFGGYRFMLTYSIANIPMVILSIFICLVLVTAAFLRTSKNADGLFILMAAGVLIRMLYGIILQILMGYGWRNVGMQALLAVMLAVIVIGAWFLFSVLMGETPLAGKNKDAWAESIKDVMTTIRGAREKTAQKANENKMARAQSAQNNAGFNAQNNAGFNAQNNASFNAQNYAGFNAQNNAGFNAQNNAGFNAQNNAGFNAQNNAGFNPYNNAGMAAGGVNNVNRVPLKTDRSLLIYILLGAVTCGIYNLWFLHSLARDVNIACEGDGNKTNGLLAFILLSFVTCGIYSFIWYYSLGNRLAYNAPRYNMNFQENGTTVLMWQLFGSMLCGIGPFIALNIIIKNTNSLCAAYNNYSNYTTY